MNRSYRFDSTFALMVASWSEPRGMLWWSGGWHPCDRYLSRDGHFHEHDCALSGSIAFLSRVANLQNRISILRLSQKQSLIFMWNAFHLEIFEPNVPDVDTCHQWHVTKSMPTWPSRRSDSNDVLILFLEKISPQKTGKYHFFHFFEPIWPMFCLLCCSFIYCSFLLLLAWIGGN